MGAWDDTERALARMTAEMARFGLFAKSFTQKWAAGLGQDYTVTVKLHHSPGQYTDYTTPPKRTPVRRWSSDRGQALLPHGGPGPYTDPRTGQGRRRPGQQAGGTRKPCYAAARTASGHRWHLHPCSPRK